MTILPEIRKLTRLPAICFAFCIAAIIVLALMLGAQQNRLAALEETALTEPDNSSLDILQSLQTDLSIRLDDVAGKLSDANAITSAGLRDYVQSAELRFDQLKNDIQNASPDLSAVFERLDKVDETLSQLSRKPEPAPVASPVKPSPNTTRPQTPATPNFILVGIELRGGERLVSISPKSSQALSDVRLIRIGETVDGWKLLSVDGSQATFEKNGQRRQLALP